MGPWAESDKKLPPRPRFGCPAESWKPIVLLGSTPHQGHLHRSENLLQLLRDGDEPMESLRGRVVYRTKDDVRDWFGRPLFPRRQINDLLYLILALPYRAWIEAIHQYYRPTRNANSTDARKRAAGWRYAPLSTGLHRVHKRAWISRSAGTPARLAARRITDEGCCGSIAAIPDGPIDEPVDQLYQRLLREIRTTKIRDADIDDIEETDDAETGRLQVRKTSRTTAPGP